jgi:hypothetical protein
MLSNYSAISAGVLSLDGVKMLIVRDCGALLLVVCALTLYDAFVPVSRLPILTASIKTLKWGERGPETGSESSMISR